MADEKIFINPFNKVGQEESTLKKEELMKEEVKKEELKNEGSKDIKF